MNQDYHINDFTESHYRELLELAKTNYQFITYDAINFNTNFILWRHDCDMSVNRALRLAQIEKDAGITATYFLNPHCEFYNLLEASQTKIVRQIIQLGHHIGLHFDAAFYQISSEQQVNQLVRKEAEWLEDWFNVPVRVFSFHNPLDYILTCEKQSYGELINCYSKLFKDKIPYCSDSNGYWRFKRLRDVLSAAADPCLQVLTHPDWWQAKPMLPRDRVCRAIEGRADALINAYDQFLEKHGRVNVGSEMKKSFDEKTT